MVEETPGLIPFWLLLFTIFGFIVGETCGELLRHRKCLQQANEELRKRLEQAPQMPSRSSTPSRNNGASSITSITTWWLFQQTSKNVPYNSHRINGRM
jgi:hypothetical protein